MPEATASAARWFLYVLECEDGSLYTGIAVDPRSRFAVHASGKGARYTRSHPPRRLLVCVPYPDRSSASKAEWSLKSMSAARKRAFVAQYLEGEAAGADAGAAASSLIRNA